MIWWLITAGGKEIGSSLGHKGLGFFFCSTREGFCCTFVLEIWCERDTQREKKKREREGVAGLKYTGLAVEVDCEIRIDPGRVTPHTHSHTD